MIPFQDYQLETYWRAIILFGQNVASYKFALGKSLLELAEKGHEKITLEDLAVPFSAHIIEHLTSVKKQSTSPSSKFLDACEKYIQGELSQTELVGVTVRLGFVNVIDAFHVVNQADIPVRFFIDDRNTATKGITLTDELLTMAQGTQMSNLPKEVEARWRLVETAWDLKVPRNVLVVNHDETAEELFVIDNSLRRRSITSSRDALNGYQKGKCFYCYRDISVAERSSILADVDHVFPHILKTCRIAYPIDGVWNLVLACQACNRGVEGKFSRLPAKRYLERLGRRNEFLIGSHHPLRETLITQTGATAGHRAQFLLRNFQAALEKLVHTWQAKDELEGVF